jgi:hypothetical protein
MNLRARKVQYTAASAFSSDEDVDGFLLHFSIFAGKKPNLVRMLLQNAVSYESLNRRPHIQPTTSSICSTKTFNNKLIAQIDQEVINRFVTSSHTLGSCCLVKNSDTAPWADFTANQSTFEDISSSVVKNDKTKGIIICFYKDYRSIMGFQNHLTVHALKKIQDLKYVENKVGLKCVPTDIISFGGFYSPLHLDNGGTSTRHILAGHPQSCTKLSIICNSMDRSIISEINEILELLSNKNKFQWI